MINYKIQVLIDEDTKHGKFRDAMYYTNEQFNALTDEQLLADKQARVDNWITYMDTPRPPTPEPTWEELYDDYCEYERRLAEIEEQLLA